MIQLLLPMMVFPPPWIVPRLKVHISRIVVLSPMMSSVSSPSYFLSWGSSPIERNGKCGCFRRWWSGRSPQHVAYPATGPDGDFRADNAEGTDFRIVSNIGGRIDQRGFMNLLTWVFPAHSNSQLAHALPSTVAWHSYQPILRLMRFWMASRTSWSPGTTILAEAGIVYLDQVVQLTFFSVDSRQRGGPACRRPVPWLRSSTRLA